MDSSHRTLPHQSCITLFHSFPKFTQSQRVAGCPRQAFFQPFRSSTRVAALSRAAFLGSLFTLACAVVARTATVNSVSAEVGLRTKELPAGYTLLEPSPTFEQGNKVVVRHRYQIRRLDTDSRRSIDLPNQCFYRVGLDNECRRVGTFRRF